MMSPRCKPGTTPSTRCRSEPQMAQLLTLTMASRGSSIFGSGTVSQRMSFLPCQPSALMAASGCAFTGAAMSVPARDRRPFTRAQSQPMKIATWNVNSLSIRLPQVLDWVQAHQPEVLVLQETKLADDKFP